jgi:hypothetical protein
MLKSAIQGRIHIGVPSSAGTLPGSVLESLRKPAQDAPAFHAAIDAMSHRYGPGGREIADKFHALAPAIGADRGYAELAGKARGIVGGYSEAANHAMREIVQAKRKAINSGDSSQIAKFLNPDALAQGDDYRNAMKHPKALGVNKFLRGHGKAVGLGLGALALGGAGYLGYRHMKKKREQVAEEPADEKSASFQKIASLAFGDRTRVRSVTRAFSV